MPLYHQYSLSEAHSHITIFPWIVWILSCPTISDNTRREILIDRNVCIHIYASHQQCHQRRLCHDDVIKCKHFPRYWSFMRGIHRSPVNSRHKGQWRGALMFSLIWAWMNGWVNNGEAGDLRRHRSHYDVTVMSRTTAYWLFWNQATALRWWYTGFSQTDASDLSQPLNSDDWCWLGSIRMCRVHHNTRCKVYSMSTAKKSNSSNPS